MQRLKHQPRVAGDLTPFPVRYDCRRPRAGVAPARRWVVVLAATVASVGWVAEAPAQLADVQDQFVFYFGRSTALASDIAGSTFDANGDAWVIGRDSLGGIRKVEFDGNQWQNERHVFATEMRIYYRSTDVAGGIEGDLQISGNLGGTPANFLLNPAPLTIEIPTGPQTPGTTQTVTYQPGELAFFTDAQGLLAPVGGGQVFEATKRLTRYDLRKTQTPTTVEPDFGNYFNEGQQAGFLGNTDWNDVFTQVISEQDIRDAAGATNGGDNFGRSFAWSSDGQSIYAVDAGTNTGGIYKIDATQTGSITRLRTDLTSASDPDRGLTVVTRILGEPAVLSTSVLDLDPTSGAVGDQIVVPGTGDGGNVGGVNVYTDAGLPGELPDPHALFTDSSLESSRTTTASRRRTTCRLSSTTRATCTSTSSRLSVFIATTRKGVSRTLPRSGSTTPFKKRTAGSATKTSSTCKPGNRPYRDSR